MRLALLIGATCVDGNTIQGPNVRVPAGVWKIVTEGHNDKTQLIAVDSGEHLITQPVRLEENTTLTLIATNANALSVYLELQT